jgi:hypothetical protein
MAVASDHEVRHAKDNAGAELRARWTSRPPCTSPPTPQMCRTPKSPPTRRRRRTTSPTKRLGARPAEHQEVGAWRAQQGEPAAGIGCSRAEPQEPVHGPHEPRRAPGRALYGSGARRPPACRGQSVDVGGHGPAMITSPGNRYMDFANHITVCSALQHTKIYLREMLAGLLLFDLRL